MINKKISILIPVYNSAENLNNFITNLISLCTKKFKSFEVILVDDESKDNSWQIIETFYTSSKFKRRTIKKKCWPT